VNTIPGGISRHPDSQPENPWYEQMKEGGKNKELLEAYRDNHRVVSEYVETLLAELDGQSVITADHANLIGERGFPIPIRLYGHPQYFPHPDLLRVPWIEIPGQRRDVRAEPPEERAKLDDETIEQRLSALGYQ